MYMSVKRAAEKWVADAGSFNMQRVITIHENYGIL